LIDLTLELLVELAQEVEVCDPIIWDDVGLEPTGTYRMIAASILEQFGSGSYNKEEKISILVAMTRLVVENFVLNSRILALESKNR
jgi:hypothetical protein